MALVYSYFASASLSGYSVVSSAAGGGPASCEGSNPVIPEYYNGTSGNLPVVRIGINAFSSCNDIETITLPNTIKIISNNAFGGSSIKNINIPDSVNSIGVSAFSVCSQLTYVKLSNNLTTLPGNLFVSCSSLKSINIPDSITGIADSVFAQCSSLDNVILGKNLKSLGNSVFAQCFNLNNLYFKGDLPSTGNSIFSLLDPSQIKIKIKKYFVTGWGDSLGGAPVVLWSDNVIKGGGAYYYAYDSYKFTNLNNLSVIGTLNNDLTEEEYSELQLTFNNVLGRDQVYRIKNKNILFLPIVLGIGFGFGAVSYVYQWYVVYKNFNDPLDPFNGTYLYTTDNAPSLTPLTEINLWFRSFPVFELTSSLSVSLKGPGKLTTKKRTFGLPHQIYLTVNGCAALDGVFEGPNAGYDFYRGADDEFGLGSKRWFNDGNDISIVYDGEEAYFNMGNHWLIIDPFEQNLYFKRPSLDSNNIPTGGWEIGPETLCQGGGVIITK